ncbi:hypothetical protein [Mammaliicoccus sciuri]|uniref:hypothetical protein n=1 Tax=Mammaliicoccus sciuri TaxID=1296 RepID=UPI0018CA89CB|nr:hypothetical protein [Mammaliicoccus sciuri]MBG9209433.1 hypothetical protein [Mammaliicoccus sciuri]
MGYEYEELVISTVYDLNSEMYPDKEIEIIKSELKEVYAKAEAFDRIKIISNKYANDLSTSAEQCIDLIEDELEDRNAI